LAESRYAARLDSPRESEAPGIYARASAFIGALLNSTANGYGQAAMRARVAVSHRVSAQMRLAVRADGR
jgi:hypothetical protein